MAGLTSCEIALASLIEIAVSAHERLTRLGAAPDVDGISLVSNRSEVFRANRALFELERTTATPR